MAIDVPARVLLGFADPLVNALLGIDAAREGSLALVPLGRGAGPAAAEPARCRRSRSPRVPLSPHEEDYPLVRAAYEASSLPDGAAARAWLGLAGGRGRRARRPAARAVPGARRDDPPARVDPGVPARARSRAPGSRRSWTPRSARSRSTSVRRMRSSRPISWSTPSRTSSRAPTCGIRAARALRLLRPGEFRREGGELCLEQPLGADASAVAFFLSDLDPVLARWGSRGYRAVNLAAGLLGGRLYLGAYGFGLGATGLTFYDDEVVRFFEPDAAGKEAIFVTALGPAARRPAPRDLPVAPGHPRAAPPGRGVSRGEPDP